MLIRPPSRTGAAAWRRRDSAVVRLLKEGIEGTRQGQGGERRRRGVKGFIHFPDELDLMFVCRVCTIRACTCVQWGVMYDVCILLLLLLEHAYYELSSNMHTFQSTMVHVREYAYYESYYSRGVLHY